MSEAFDRAKRDLLMQILEIDVHFNQDELRITRCTISQKFDVKLDYADDENFFVYEPLNNLIGPCPLNCNCARCQKDEIR